MKYLKIFFWFAVTNIAFMLTLSTLFAIIRIFVPSFNTGGIWVESAVIGFASSLFSLFTSKFMIKWQMKLRMINRNPSNNKEAMLDVMLEKLSGKLGIKTPELAVYDDVIPNAFATGWSKNHALVAFSTGLLNSMTDDEIEGVMAHELSHVVNGDMITMTMVQGVVNTFVVAISKIVSRAIVSSTDNSTLGTAAYMGLQILLGLLLQPIVMVVSRMREYRADFGSAQLVGKDKMIAALQRLKMIEMKTEDVPQSVATMGIIDVSVRELFSSHPTLDKRIYSLNKI